MSIVIFGGGFIAQTGIIPAVGGEIVDKKHVTSAITHRYEMQCEDWTLTRLYSQPEFRTYNHRGL